VGLPHFSVVRHRPARSSQEGQPGVWSWRKSLFVLLFALAENGLTIVPPADIEPTSRFFLPVCISCWTLVVVNVVSLIAVALRWDTDLTTTGFVDRFGNSPYLNPDSDRRCAIRLSTQSVHASSLNDFNGVMGVTAGMGLYSINSRSEFANGSLNPAA